ncbi:MAG: hypothetical protein KAK04_22385, partial [Cyclobacteriaceae bacterium]|nr:hypothetical protein [Cyclobacteriaceae bacterium]
PIVIRLHENPGGYLLYVLNQGWTTEKINIQLNVPKEGNYMLTEILQDREIFMVSENESLEIVTDDISPSDVEIWKIVTE